MARQEFAKKFGDYTIRSVWDTKRKKWYFVALDVVDILTHTADPKDYIKRTRRSDHQLSGKWDRIVTPIVVSTPGGPQTLNCFDVKGLFRFIQTMSSRKVEPFKLWMANLAAQCLESMGDSIHEVLADHGKLPRRLPEVADAEPEEAAASAEEPAKDAETNA